jgi:hypothetical protein
VALAEGARPGGKPVPAVRHLGIIRVDFEALRRGRVDGDEVCEIAGLGRCRCRRPPSCSGPRCSSWSSLGGPTPTSPTWVGA